jgi:hypothetical protein
VLEAAERTGPCNSLREMITTTIMSYIVDSVQKYVS